MSISNLGCIQYFHSISGSGVVTVSLLSTGTGESIFIRVIGVQDGICTSGGMSCFQSVYQVQLHISQQATLHQSYTQMS